MSVHGEADNFLLSDNAGVTTDVAGELSAHAHKHTSSDEELAHELAVFGAAMDNFSATTVVELYGF